MGAPKPIHNWACAESHEMIQSDGPEEGYPSDEYLEHLEHHDGMEIWHDPWRFVDYIKRGWSYPSYMWEEEAELFMSTGGWSGNESIISALHGTMFWMVFWENHRRGGHYTFEMKEPRKKESDVQA